MHTHVTFLHADAFHEAIGGGDGPRYDAMSCMFCLHYAARDEASIHRAFQNASASLTPGGVFFGVCADGEMITHVGTMSNDIVAITLHAETTGRWGRAYTFRLLDSIVSDHNIEFVTRPDDLVQVASTYGLVPLSMGDCADWKTKDGHVFPNVVGTAGQTVNERMVSSMYFVFAFVKR